MTTQIAREETRCRHIGYSCRLAARVLLYASSHRQDNTYHGLCCTSRGALASLHQCSGICVHNTSFESNFELIHVSLSELIFNPEHIAIFVRILNNSDKHFSDPSNVNLVSSAN